MTARLYLTTRIEQAYVHMVSRLRDAKREDPLAPVTILLPSAGVIDDVARRLGDNIAVELLQFYSLGQRVLKAAGSPVREINETAARRLIRHILMELAVEEVLSAFAKVWGKPGFLDVILAWIREMKGQGITPEAYTAYAETSGTGKDRELAVLYSRYQNFMNQHKYSDADGLLWLAAEALEQQMELYRRDEPLYILGFDQFTPVQLRILQALVGRFRESTFYLLWDEDRPQKSLALGRLRETRQILERGLKPTVEVLPEGEMGQSLPGSLQVLQRELFEGALKGKIQEKGVGHAISDTVEGVREGIHLVEAPLREAEVRWTLREAKRLLMAGISPLDVAVLAANREAYRPLVQTVAVEYDLPVLLDKALISNPAVATLVNLLRLPGDFPWAETFDALRSPYLRRDTLSDSQIDILDRLSRERPVVAGREQWAFALQPLALEVLEADDEDLGPSPLVATVPPEELVKIEHGLMDFFDMITPPEKASYRDYTWWLQTRLLGHFPTEPEQEGISLRDGPTLDMLGRCHEGPHPRRDLTALQAVMDVMRRLLTAAEIVPGDAEVTWGIYREEVLALLKVSILAGDSTKAGIRFEAMEGARGRVVEYLFVLGLSEGEFPSPQPPDPLYAPKERETHPLPLVRYSPANDASLWWQVIGGVYKQLVLLRPTIDDNGAPWEPSPYWDAVCEGQEKPQVDKLPIAESLEPHEAATEGELLVVFSRIGAGIVPQGLRGKWDYVRQAAAVIQQRESYRPPGEFEGMLRSADLKAELSARFGERHTWSASRLNRYAQCPYGFFAEHVLKLEAYQDPEEGMNVMQRGSLLHAILEDLYQQLVETGLAPIRSNLEKILQVLEIRCNAIFLRAPQRYGFRPGALWEYEKEELKRLLQALVTWECEENGDNARFKPYLLEVIFGIGRGGTPALEVEAESARFRLRGVVDRVDRDEQGNLRVIDYKSGSTTYSKADMQKGLATQTALYALVAERYWLRGEGRVVESHYWLIPTRSSSGSLIFEVGVRQDEVVENIIQQAAWCVEQVRCGLFPSAPAKPVQWGKACVNRCDYGSICRVSRQSIAKARRGGWG